ncbi:MAG: sulfite exporter TauE/SafE family protein [Bdellovibrionota bacterium]
MIFWAVIGTVVGAILGLTGAGGAVIAVPLFTQFLDADLRAATLYSLYAVFISAILNWFLQRKQTEYSIAALTAAFAPLGAYVGKFLKENSAVEIIQGLFVGICLFSLANIWIRKPPRAEKSSSRRNKPRTAQAIKSMSSGIFLGCLTSMTGLGGGVLLVPWLAGPMKLPLQKAVPTSLFAIMFASLSSLVAQHERLRRDFDLSSVALLAAGSIASALMVRRFVSSLQAERLDKARQVVLTAVLLFSIFSVAFS